jgi:hypothetical protein
MLDAKIRAITVACLGGAYMSWSELSDYAADGLTFSDWVAGILAGVCVGGAGGLFGYFAMRWANRRYFGDQEDE